MKRQRPYSNQEILESWINGQKKQCAKQYLSLDSDERKDFSRVLSGNNCSATRV